MRSALFLSEEGAIASYSHKIIAFLLISNPLIPNPYFLFGRAIVISETP